MEMEKEMEKATDEISTFVSWNEIDMFCRGFKAGWDACHKELKGW